MNRPLLLTLPSGAQAREDAWTWLSIGACGLVWLLVQAIAPLGFFTRANDTAGHASGVAWLIAVSSVWLLLWCLVHRMGKGEGAVLPHLHGVMLALAINATLVEWGLPVLWFALGWAWHEAWLAAARTLLLGLLVRHHLQHALPGGWCTSLRRVWAVVVLMTVAATAGWHVQQTRSDPDALPYVQNVQPSVLLMRRGPSTHQALEALWPQED